MTMNTFIDLFGRLSSLYIIFVIALLLNVDGRPRATSGGVSGQHVSSFVHSWDCISCPNNTMLAGDFGTFNDVDFNLSDSWWIDEIAKSYAAVSLNHWLDSRKYNGTGEEIRIQVARKLRAANPNLKILYYQAADRGALSPYAVNAIMSHKDWWLKDDNGKVIWFGGDVGTHPVVDLTVPDAQVWFANLTLSLFSSEEDAKNLCNGIFVDAAAYAGQYKNLSTERFDQLFKGRMESMQIAQNMFTKLNGGDVWGNPDPAVWEPTPSWYHGPAWNLTLQYHNGGFDPWFGNFAVLDKDGEWDVAMMEKTFNEVIAASNAGHSIILHSFPGPATTPFTNRGTAPHNFRVNSWVGSEKVPSDVAGCQEASANLLVQSLAPFLIVANERVFFSYGWFWNLEDGYIPCHGKAVCGMPDEWFPEFSKPLGPPKSAAVKNGTVWTREFQHASVYVDLSDRRKSRIDWK